MANNMALTNTQINIFFPIYVSGRSRQSYSLVEQSQKDIEFTRNKTRIRNRHNRHNRHGGMIDSYRNMVAVYFAVIFRTKFICRPLLNLLYTYYYQS